jgi:hypothetical protein
VLVAAVPGVVVGSVPPAVAVPVAAGVVVVSSAVAVAVAVGSCPEAVALPAISATPVISASAAAPSPINLTGKILLRDSSVLAVIPMRPDAPEGINAFRRRSPSLDRELIAIAVVAMLVR